MFFFVSKVFDFLTYPITWILGLMLLALFSKKATRKRKLLVAAIIAFFVFSNAFIVDEFIRIWEVPAISYSEIKEPYDAGIVLGGAITYDPTLKRFQIQRQGDRIIQAVLLYRSGLIRKIIFSGGAGALDEPDLKEGPVVEAFLLSLGIPKEDILIESESRNTRQNAVYTKELIDKNFQNGRFLLITSAMHQRRAIQCFEKVGVHVTSFSVDRYCGPRKFKFSHLFIPKSRMFYSWEVLIHEIIGYFMYRINGYI